MKKFLVLLAILIIPSIGSAQNINLGTYGNSTYYLQTESLRACSTAECLYIIGKDQEYIAAKIQIVPQGKDSRFSGEDILSYNKSVGFVEKSALFARDGTRFVLITTASYDVNGNPIDVKNETEEIKTFVYNQYSVTTGTGGANETRGAVDVKVRRIAWSNVFPGTPQELLVRNLLAYAEANYAEIDAKSRSINYIQVSK